MSNHCYLQMNTDEYIGVHMRVQRGIQDAAKVGQIVDYAGMLYGSCSPTDIDLSLDFGCNVFIFVEFKYKGYGLTTGQKIHLMGMVNAIEAGGKEAYAILAHHNGEPEIAAADSKVAMVYSSGSWVVLEDATLHDLVSEIHSSYKLKRAKV